MWLRYPNFHPKRPKFFNMATFFTSIIYTLHFQVSDYLKTSSNLTEVDLNTGDPDEIAYKAYVLWEESGGEELQLAANRLTNRQLFWIAVARFSSAKYHPMVPASIHPASRLQFEFCHVFYKDFQGFQEAFKCEMTGEEKTKFKEYLRKLKKFTEKYENLKQITTKRVASDRIRKWDEIVS
jgi:hypothetical protein